jgi:hypothetical protein
LSGDDERVGSESQLKRQEMMMMMNIEVYFVESIVQNVER